MKTLTVILATLALVGVGAAVPADAANGHRHQKHSKTVKVKKFTDRPAKTFTVWQDMEDRPGKTWTTGSF